MATQKQRDADAERREQEDRATIVAQAAIDAIMSDRGRHLPGAESIRFAVACAIAELTWQWRKHAELIEDGGRRGAKGNSSSLRNAAGFAAEMARTLASEVSPYLQDHAAGLPAYSVAEIDEAFGGDPAAETVAQIVVGVDKTSDNVTLVATHRESDQIIIDEVTTFPADTFPDLPADTSDIFLDVSSEALQAAIEHDRLEAHAAAVGLPPETLATRENIESFLRGDLPPGVTPLIEYRSAKPTVAMAPLQPDAIRQLVVTTSNGTEGTQPMPDMPTLVSASQAPRAESDQRPAGVEPISWAGLWGELTSVGGSTSVAHRSPSQLTSFGDCGLRYQLQRRLAVPSRPMWGALAGSALHSCIERYERAWVDAGVSQDVAEAIESKHGSYVDQFSAAFAVQIADAVLAGGPYAKPATWYASGGGKEDHAWWKANGHAMLRDYVAARLNGDLNGFVALAPAMGQPAGIELPFTLRLTGVEAPIEGFIDWAGFDIAGGYLTVIDYKFGRSLPADDIQLKTYAVAVAEMTGGAVSAVQVAYWNGRKAEIAKRQIVDVAAARAELEYRYGVMDRAERIGVYAPQPSNFCVACPVIHSCPIKGRLASESPTS